MGYDLDSRQTSVAFPTGLNLTHTFDAVSNRISTLDPDNGLTSWIYDQQNRIVLIANPLAELTTITWDALDREQHKVLANGMAVSHAFDASGRETLLENRNAAGVGLAIFTNSYDPVSNRIGVIELDGTLCTFGYDRTYQLTLEQRSGANAYNTSYVYDPLGNRLQKFDSGALTASQCNAANELTLVTPPAGPPTTSTFDPNGNLATQNTGGALTTYTWDPENRLLTVSDNTGITTAAYSADGLRQKKVTGAGTTNFVWDDQNVLQERDGSLAKTAQYTDWPGFWGGLASQSRSGTSSFFGFDSQASTRVLVAIGAAITDSYSFKAFGEELAAGSGTVNPFRYVGRYGYQRDVADSYYVRARYPHVNEGRWISRDPVGGLIANDFLYVENRPVRRRDPSGLQSLQDPSIGLPLVRKSLQQICSIANQILNGGVNSSDIYDDVNSCLAAGQPGCLPGNRLTRKNLLCLAAITCGQPVINYNPGSCCSGGANQGDCAWTAFPGGQASVMGKCLSNPHSPTINVCAAAYGDPRCWPFGPASGGARTITHELLHCCGIGHGPSNEEPKTCNTILACCLFRAAQPKLSPPRCNRWQLGVGFS